MGEDRRRTANRGDNGDETAAAPEQSPLGGEELPLVKSTKPPAFQFYESKFWRKVNKTDECWLWTASVDHDGYGQFHAGKQTRAHRFSFQLAYGWLPERGVIMHKCDTPRCVRPDHLVAGTHEDNVRDKIAKGRLRVPHGADHWSRRLSLEQIKAARSSWESGMFTQARLAEEYGVSAATINRAIRQLAWEERNV
jgi:hypothetical protein